jgi:hypothetical protein
MDISEILDNEKGWSILIKLTGTQERDKTIEK